MFSSVKEFFHFSRGERRGTMVLISLLFMLISWYFIRDIGSVTTTEDFSQFKKEIASFYILDEDSKSKKAEAELFLFNPNEIGKEQWILLGFSEKQAISIEKYKASGAIFKVKKDLKKLFMVDEEKYQELFPFIDLPESLSISQKKTSDSFKSKAETFVIVLKTSEQPIYDGFKGLNNVHYWKQDGKYIYAIPSFKSTEQAEEHALQKGISYEQIIKVNNLFGFYPIKQKTTSISTQLISINLADTSELKNLKGIGASYAKRIIKYRNLLGGFVSVDQLEEIYNFPKELIVSIGPSIFIDLNAVKKININTATIEELKAHPYINWNVANSIVQIRNNFGNFDHCEDIMKSDLINEELFLKIAPYLTTE